jgi:hypothetical protein
MAQTSLNRIADIVVRRRRTVGGDIAPGHGPVLGDERRGPQHGDLLHRRCVAYRRRA